VRFVEPDAGGAGDALEDQRRFRSCSPARPSAAHEALLHVGMVEQAEFLQIDCGSASRGVSGSASRWR
jgi:hypothetical protein